MLRYAITSRALYPGDEHEKQAALLHEAYRWAAAGIDFIQLREKDLPAADIATLARGILKAIAQATSPSKLLINSRPEIAIATGAHGVHLATGAHEINPTQVREIYASANLPAPVVTVSCHTINEILLARTHQADAILFAPVFEKVIGQETIPGQGLHQLQAACRAASPIPVYALGGVTLQNAGSCLEAGAKGIAGIRLFRGLAGEVI